MRVLNQVVAAASGASPLMLSRNVADGTKNKLPVTALAEIEQPVVIAGRTADEHVLQHRLRDARSAAVTDEVCAELTVAGPAERHVVSQNLDFFSVLLDDGQRVVREGRFLGVTQLDVGEFLAANDALLGLDGKSVPPLHVVKVLLHDHVAAARKGRIFVAHDCSLSRSVCRADFRCRRRIR